MGMETTWIIASFKMHLKAFSWKAVLITWCRTSAASLLPVPCNHRQRGTESLLVPHCRLCSDVEEILQFLTSVSLRGRTPGCYPVAEIWNDSHVLLTHPCHGKAARSVINAKTSHCCPKSVCRHHLFLWIKSILASERTQMLTGHTVLLIMSILAPSV